MATRATQATQSKPETKPVAPKPETQALAERPAGALAAADADALMFEQDVGGGMEGTTQESFAIPFLSILQSNSPQVDEASGSAIEGARAGMFFENVTGRMSSGKPDAGVRFVPCAYRRVFLRWGPRGGEGAGFKGEISPEDVALMRERGALVELDGRLFVPREDGSVDPKRCDRVSDTRNHYVLLLSDDGESWQQAVLSLTSTQIKKSRTLMSALSSVKLRGANGMYTPPTFANVIHATTIAESNDKGNWFGIRMEIEGRVGSAALYSAARAFRDLVVRGSVTVKYDDGARGDGAEGSSESRRPSDEGF